jgi:hypothetical protein
VVAKEIDEIPRGLDLLKAQLAETEDLIDHLLSERRQAIDFDDCLTLEPFEPGVGPGVGWLWLRHGGNYGQEIPGKRDEEQPSTHHLRLLQLIRRGTIFPGLMKVRRVADRIVPLN